jgi:hypothetical protein
MNLDEKDLDEMVAKGRKVNGYSKPVPKSSEELKALLEIKSQLEYLIAKPDPKPIVIPDQKAPVVNVSPPNVNLETAKPIAKWKLSLKKDLRGHTTEIIAIAIP